MRKIDSEKMWEAVAGRDSSMDGVFVYGVESTGIYCRPSCPSRRPRRDRVRFFRGPDEAEAAGFRACMRCHPRGRQEPEPSVALAQRAARYIDQQMAEGEGEKVSLRSVAEALGASPFHLHRVFKRVMGVTPHAYAATVRMERLKAGLRAGDDVTGAMYGAGYGSPRQLYGASSVQMGMTPGAYRKGGKGMEIRYTIANSSLGRVLVAATERGLCAVHLGDEDGALVAELRAEYPAAHLSRDDNGMDEWAEPIMRGIEERRPYLDAVMPLDVAGTPFQMSVWNELRAIPYGTTRSYGQVARAIGKAGAVRAVAQACKANHVALVIPCHRVVRDDGPPGGYKWGAERKRALLEAERSASRQEAGAR